MAWRHRVGSINSKVERGGDSTNDGHDGEAIGYRRSSRSRQAPTRATNARNENIVRTLFQKFHGLSYPALARASSPGDASAATLASCSFSGTFTKAVSRNPPPMASTQARATSQKRPKRSR